MGERKVSVLGFLIPSDYSTLNRDALNLPPGSEGLVVQEHFQGNRTPHTDPNHGVPFMA